MTRIEKVAEFAKENKIEIAVIGPESPLGNGIVDELEKNGIKCVGPCKEAARIETDKSFMRNLFEKYNVKDQKELRKYLPEWSEYEEIFR